jgi:hypothetical protein
MTAALIFSSSQPQSAEPDQTAAEAMAQAPTSTLWKWETYHKSVAVPLQNDK